MERLQEVDRLCRASERFQNGPQSCPADGVKGLCQIHREEVDVLSLFPALLSGLSGGKDRVPCASVAAETPLSLGDNALQEVFSQSVDKDASQEFTSYAQQ